MNFNEQKKRFSNVLVISGTGRNTGKTTFVCSLIEKFKQYECIAVKISSHFHELPEDAKFIHNSDKFQIIEEKDIEGKKDSQKMLIAGAKKVFYVQSKDESLPEVLKYLKLNNDQPFIFESGAISKYFPEALHICIAGNEPYKPCKEPEYILSGFSDKMASFLDSLQFENNKFTIDANA